MTVQKIFYTAIGVFVYLYLFLSVPGSFDLQLGVVDDHRLLIPLLIVAAVVATYLLIRHFWDRIKGLWEKAKQGERSWPAPATTSSRFCCRRSAPGSQS